MKKCSRLTRAMLLVGAEVERATQNFRPFNSTHEGYAVILGELDELWEEVRRKPSPERDKALKAEAIQVAAMGVRFLMDVCLSHEDSKEAPHD